LPFAPISMPKHPTPSASSQTISDKDEAQLSEAKIAYQNGDHKSIMAAARAHNIEHLYFTLRRRIQGTTLPRKEAQVQLQLLTKAEETTLIDWLKYLALTGHALNKRTICPKIRAILAAKGKHVDPKHPSKSWIRRFINRHLPDLKLGRGSGLDPKRARAFNFEKVHEHFKIFTELLDKHNIPWRNVYNMDEKGIQMGGGRKGRRTKFFYSADDKMKYRIQSDDLQLVTVLDSVCADGTSEIGPGFVFPGSTMHQQWFDEPGPKYMCVIDFQACNIY